MQRLFITLFKVAIILCEYAKNGIILNGINLTSVVANKHWRTQDMLKIGGAVTTTSEEERKTYII